jgi:hypothetical protein
MPICFKHNLCFVHIPKTAGTTIEKALGIDTIENLYQTKKFKEYGVPPQHLTIEELSKELDLKNFKLFTIVRNPFDRLVSEFVYQKTCWRTKDYHDLSFSEFVNTCLSLKTENRKWIFDSHLELQVDFIRGEYPVKVFKYENLQECFDWLKEQTGENLKFGHEKKSNKKHYTEFYDSEDLIRIVEDFYRVDLDYFDYSF